MSSGTHCWGGGRYRLKPRSGGGPGHCAGHSPRRPGGRGMSSFQAGGSARAFRETVSIFFPNVFIFKFPICYSVYLTFQGIEGYRGGSGQR